MLSDIFGYVKVSLVKMYLTNELSNCKPHVLIKMKSKKY